MAPINGPYRRLTRKQAIEDELVKFMVNKVRAMAPTDKKCYPYRYAGKDGLGNTLCECPRTPQGHKAIIQVDVNRSFPGPWFYGGPDWRSKVLDTVEKRKARCERITQWEDTAFLEKLRQAFDPNSPIGKEVTDTFHRAAKTAATILGPIAVVFPPLLIVEEALATGELSMKIIEEIAKDLKPKTPAIKPPAYITPASNPPPSTPSLPQHYLPPTRDLRPR